MEREHGTLSDILSALKEAFIGSPLAPLELPSMVRPLDPDSVCIAAGVGRLAELGKREVAEISLEELYDVDRLAERLRQGVEGRQLLWVMADVDDHVREFLASYFPALAHPLNDSGTVVGFNVRRMLSRFLVTVPGARHKLKGMDVTSAPMKVRSLLRDHRVRVHHRSLFTRLIHDPRTWVYVAIFVYSVLRALPVIYVPQFHGSVAVLWSIDVLTAIPYAWGVVAMVTASSPVVRFIALSTTIATFMAPYIYFWMYGDDYPWYVVIIVSIMILVSLAIEVVRIVQDRRLKQIYASE